MSEKIDKIFESLCKAQAQITHVTKTGVNKNKVFTSTYAQLPDVIEAIRGACFENNLAYLQPAKSCEWGAGCTTMICHSSGQWISEELIIPYMKFKIAYGKQVDVCPDPQMAGSCVTYARRYMLLGIFGIPTVDDDAEYAMNRDYDQPLVTSKDLVGHKGTSEKIVDQYISEEQALEIGVLIKNNNVDLKKFCQHYKINDIRNLFRDQYWEAHNLVKKGGKRK
jgi:hypothetical protein